MITDRLIESSDLPLLAESLSKDEFHKTTKPEFFREPGTICKVYEDEQGPVLFARASKTLRLDLQYVDNADHKRNLTAMLDGFEGMARKARENGFVDICFNTNSILLKQFCIKRLGFEEVDGCVLRKKL